MCDPLNSSAEWEIRRRLDPTSSSRILQNLLLQMRPFQYLPGLPVTWVLTAYLTLDPDAHFEESSWRLRQYGGSRFSAIAADSYAVLEVKSGGGKAPRQKARCTVDVSQFDSDGRRGWPVRHIMRAQVIDPPPPFPSAPKQLDWGADTLYPRFAVSYRRRYFIGEGSVPVRGTFDDEITFFDLARSPPASIGQMIGAQLELKGDAARVAPLLEKLHAGSDVGISKRARGIELLRAS